MFFSSVLIYMKLAWSTLIEKLCLDTCQKWDQPYKQTREKKEQMDRTYYLFILIEQIKLSYRMRDFIQWYHLYIHIFHAIFLV